MAMASHPLGHQTHLVRVRVRVRVGVKVQVSEDPPPLLGR